jgi:hypothetical protein
MILGNGIEHALGTQMGPGKETSPGSEALDHHAYLCSIPTNTAGKLHILRL